MTYEEATVIKPGDRVYILGTHSGVLNQAPQGNSYYGLFTKHTVNRLSGDCFEVQTIPYIRPSFGNLINVIWCRKLSRNMSRIINIILTTKGEE